MKLHPFQSRAVAHVLRRLRALKSILVVSPVGTGKTYMFAELARRWTARGKRVVVLAHRKELLDQSADRVRNLGLDVSIIRGGAKHLEDPGARVQIASVQTLSRRENRPQADYIIVDEAHHTPAKSYRKILENYPDAKIVGFTATPLHASEHHTLADLYEEMYEAISIPEAIEDKFLAPVKGKVYVLEKLGKVKKVGGDFSLGPLGKAMSRRKIVGDIVDRWKAHGKGRSTILFAATRKQCQKMVKAFRKAGVAAQYLDGKSKLEDRKDILARFAAGDFPVLCNVELFTEGTDIPRVKCIILARPTYSMGLWLQMVGRGQRPWNGETCLYLDHGGLCGAFNSRPDVERDWKLGGKGRQGVVVCRRCDAPRDADIPKCPECEAELETVSEENSPVWIPRGYEYDAEEFLAARDAKRAEAIRLYVEEKKSTVEITKILGVKTKKSVADWVKSAGFIMRSAAESRGDAANTTKRKWGSLYRAGWRVPQIAKKFGVSTAPIYKFLQAKDLIIPGGRPRGPSAAVSRATGRVTKLYLLGTPAPAIVKKLKNSISVPTVYKILRDSGINRRSRPEMFPRNEVLARRVISMHKHQTVSGIAKSLKMAASTVNKILTRHEIKRRSRADAVRLGKYNDRRLRQSVKSEASKAMARNGSVRSAAQSLGVSHNALSKRLKW